MDATEASGFLLENHRAVVATLRRKGGVQLSPVLVGSLENGKAHISTREGAIKVKNLRRDPRLWLCVLTDAFFGTWLYLEGRAFIISMPEALDGLRKLYRQIAGEHPDWADFDRAMHQERRVLLEVEITYAGPRRSG